MGNIFQERKIVERYTKTRGIPPAKVLRHLARELLKKVRCTFPNEKKFYFLESGIGDGRLAVSLARALQGRVLLYGFDNSKPMLVALQRRIEQNKIENIKAILWDLEKEKPQNGWKNQFHLCILSYLLPHLENWRRALDTLTMLVRVGGYLAFVREEAPLVRLRYNCFDGIEDGPAYQFWQEYHQLRRNKLAQKGFSHNWENFVCDVSKALDYLYQKGLIAENITKQSIDVLSWKRKTSISAMLETLRYRDFLIFRRGLERREQIELWKTMKNWCIEKNYLYKVLDETPKLIVQLVKKVRS